MKLRMKPLISCLVLLVLIGCADKKEQVVFTPPIKVTIISPPKPAPIIMKPVEFIVVTTETRNKLDSERVWYAMTVKSYENMSTNTQEILRYIRDQKSVNSYWENVNK